MKQVENQEVQQELFQEFSGETKKVERLPQITRTQKPIFFSTSTEHIVLACILLILAGCLVFFLGVLRGKSLSAAQPVSTQVRTTRVQSEAAPPKDAQPAAAQAKAASMPPVESQPPGVSAVKKSAISTGKKPTTVNTDITKPYTVQLVTFKKKELAEKEVAAIQKAGFTAFYIPSEGYFHVCGGQYENKEDAKKDLKLFATRFKYKDCFLRRR